MRMLLDKNRDTVSRVEETEGGRRPSGVPSTIASSAGDRTPAPPPDPEVPEKPVRRRFTAEYKLKILAEADNCTEPGQIGAILRREGLYSTHLSNWRRKRREGTLISLSPRKRGPKAEKNPLAPKVAQLERENERLKAKLKTAETIIEVQKKVSGLLGIDLESQEKRADGSGGRTVTSGGGCPRLQDSCGVQGHPVPQAHRFINAVCARSEANARTSSVARGKTTGAGRAAQ